MLPNIEFELVNDANAIAILNKTVHDKHYEKHPNRFATYDKEAFEKWFIAYLNQEDTISVLINYGGEYIGYAIAKIRKTAKDNPFSNPDYESLYIDQMSILSKYQNQGVGDQLIDFIIKLAKDKEIKNIELDVWSDNVQAKHFYEKKGFKKIREIMSYSIE